jgi:predicted ATP-binding protein involved in virulence
VYFDKLEIKQWQQFEEVELQLHERLTIITGSNGCGKTTLLSLFAKHSGWAHNSLSIPKKDKKNWRYKILPAFLQGKK